MRRQRCFVLRGAVLCSTSILWLLCHRYTYTRAGMLEEISLAHSRLQYVCVSAVIRNTRENGKRDRIE